MYKYVNMFLKGFFQGTFNTGQRQSKFDSLYNNMYIKITNRVLESVRAHRKLFLLSLIRLRNAKWFVVNLKF